MILFRLLNNKRCKGSHFLCSEFSLLYQPNETMYQMRSESLFIGILQYEGVLLFVQNGQELRVKPSAGLPPL